MNIALEGVLAAIIADQDGEIYLPLEVYMEDRGGMAIAIDYFDESNSLRLTLVKEDEIDADDAG